MRRHRAASDEPVTLIQNRPTADQYMHLRAQTNWQPVSTKEVETAMVASLFSILAVSENRVVGCARIVGDGGLYFYVQDMLVDQRMRGRGIGARMMKRLLQWLDRHAGDHAFVGLMAAEGTENFYRGFGFEPRKDGQPGMSLPVHLIHAGKNISPSK